MESLRKHFEDGWWQKLSPFLLSDHFNKIGLQLNKEAVEGLQVTPLFNDTFRAFRECPYKDLKVVILGQDPYPGKGVADGLAFSARTQRGNIPKSLEYIIDAVEKDVYDGFAIGFNEDYLNPDLTRWANQGVLLLNTALSTHVGKTEVHLELWSPFIAYVLNVLKTYNTGIIYMLLGSKARAWRTLIDGKNNHILTASHPNSTYHQGLTQWDCNKIFSQTNAILKQNQGEEAQILW